MKNNAYGAQLDRNGYAPSIMQPAWSRCCYLCGRPAGGEKMDRHEPFGGANRQKSKALGLWVNLHHWGCHEGPGSVHGGDSAAARQLRKDAQTAAMLRYGWSRERWIAEFGKSELTEEECGKLLGNTSSVGCADTFPSKGKAAAEENSTAQRCGGEAPTAPLRCGMVGEGRCVREATEGVDRRGKSVGDVIRALWPEHARSSREGAGPGGAGEYPGFERAGFRLIDGPELPY